MIFFDWDLVFVDVVCGCFCVFCIECLFLVWSMFMGLVVLGLRGGWMLWFLIFFVCFCEIVY